MSVSFTPRSAVMPVAMALRSDRSFERGVCAGALQHIVQNRHMTVLTMDRTSVSLIRHWSGAGILAHITDLKQARQLLRLRVPVVDTAGCFALAGIVHVGMDPRAIANLAADHLYERGLRNLACYRDGRIENAALTSAFGESVARRGLRAIPPPARPRNDRWGHNYFRSITRWLLSLPKPVGLFAPSDIGGRWVLGLCYLAGIAVPGDVAILGVGNDECLCYECFPPLSSIRLPGEAVGMQAARVLEQLMSGKPAPRQPILLQPEGIAVRRSTDMLAVSSPDVAQALQLIRQHVGDAINVEQIARTLAVSRRSLERRFRTVVGRSLLDEIHNTKIDLAKHLLIHTDRSIDQIAAATGLRNPHQLRRLFHSLVGEVPSAFRQQMRSHGP